MPNFDSSHPACVLLGWLWTPLWLKGLLYGGLLKCEISWFWYLLVCWDVFWNLAVAICGNFLRRYSWVSVGISKRCQGWCKSNRCFELLIVLFGLLDKVLRPEFLGFHGETCRRVVSCGKFHCASRTLHFECDLPMYCCLAPPTTFGYFVTWAMGGKLRRRGLSEMIFPNFVP